MFSKHYKNQRRKREKLIKKHLNGDGRIIDSFIIDKRHSDGIECHSVTENGIILIYNYHTGNLITKLIARRPQVERYYKNINKNPPVWLLDLCDWHESLGYNK